RGRADHAVAARDLRRVQRRAARRRGAHPASRPVPGRGVLRAAAGHGPVREVRAGPDVERRVRDGRRPRRVRLAHRLLPVPPRPRRHRLPGRAVHHVRQRHPRGPAARPQDVRRPPARDRLGRPDPAPQRVGRRSRRPLGEPLGRPHGRHAGLHGGADRARPPRPGPRPRVDGWSNKGVSKTTARDGLERLLGLLEEPPDEPDTTSGYLDLTGPAPQPPPSLFQSAMESTFLPQIYERVWRPIGFNVAKGWPIGPDTAAEHAMARSWLGLSRPGSAARPPATVLDVACGPGNVTRALAEGVGQDGLVVGLDTAQTMLARAVRDTPPPGPGEPDIQY